MFAIDERLSNMDRLGIDVGVVSPAPLDVLEDQGLALDLIQASNDGLLELCTGHPDRFVMLASLPMPNAEASLAELDRIASEPALRGITFPSQATLHRPDQLGIEPLLTACRRAWPPHYCYTLPGAARTSGLCSMTSGWAFRSTP